MKLITDRYSILKRVIALTLAMILTLSNLPIAVGEVEAAGETARTTFSFATATPDAIDFSKTKTYTNIASCTDDEETDGATTVAYSITTGDAATVDENGIVTFTKAGSVEVTATIAETTTYAEATETYTIEAKKGTRNITVTSSDESNFIYGTDAMNLKVKGTCTSLEDGESVKHTITSGDTIASIDENTGLITLKDGQVGSFTVTMTVAESDKYEEATATKTIEVKYLAIPSDAYTIVDANGKTAVNGVFASTPTTIKATGGYTLSTSNLWAEGSTWQEEIQLTNEAATFYIKENSTRCITDAVTENLSSATVDATVPVITSSITGNPINSKYYQDTATLVITVTEENFDENNTTVNITKDDATYTPYSISWVNNGDKTHTASIPLTVEGTYKATVNSTDTVGNVSGEHTVGEFVVDTTAPVVTVTYDPDTNAAAYAQRTATITVKDTYFDIDQNLLTYSITKDNAAATADTDYEVSAWTDNGNGVYSKTVTFKEDGVYNFVVTECKDMTDKTATLPDAGSFTLDTTAPTVMIAYDNNTETNDKYFTGSRTATITIEEVNFEEAGFTANITATDKGGNTISAPTVVWSTNGNAHTGTVMFNIDANYTFEPSFKDQAGLAAEIKYAEGSTATTAFVIDNVVPTGVITADKFASESWETLLTTISFGLFSKDMISINVKPSDELSGLKSVSYYKTATEITPDETTSWTNLEERITEGQDNPICEISTEENYNERFIIYVRLEDKSGNISYLSTDGMIFDDFETSIDIVPKDEKHKNSIYGAADSVELLIGVTDQIEDNQYVGSGLAEVKYEVKNGNTNIITQSATLYSSDGTDLNIDTYEYDGEILVDKENCNDNHIQIIVTVSDQAGNVTTETKEILIDTVKPTIEVEYDLNGDDDDATYDAYFKSDRVATVTVTERNFVEENVEFTVDKDGQAYSIPSENITWTVSTDNPTTDASIHTATVKFDADGDYTNFNVTCEDIAGNKADGISYKDDAVTQIKEFTIDKTVADIVVSYDNNTAYNDSYFNESRTATITVTERNFDAERFSQSLYGYDNSGVKFELETSTWTTDSSNSDIHRATVLFDKDADYVIEDIAIAVTDKAGNYINVHTFAEGSVASASFTVDNIDPIVTTSYSNNDVRNSKYFKADRTVTIVVEEHNFNAKDFVATVTAKDQKGSEVAIQNYAEYLMQTTSWAKSGDTYTAKIDFTTEANYSFNVGYTDLANRANEKVILTNGTMAPNAFVIDKTNPTGNIQIGEWKESVNQTPWDQFLNTITFGLWTKNAVEVTINFADTLSYVDEVYQFRTDSPMTYQEVVDAKQWNNVSFVTNGYTSFEVNPDERFVVYTHIIDKSGNELYISSDGVIVDATLPSVETVAPEVTVQPTVQPVNGIYNTNVSVDVKVIDPMVGADKVYSGLQKITYVVTNMGTVTQEGTLFERKDASPTMSELVQLYDQAACIVVDKALNNSNDVQVVISAIDNAGNSTQKELALMIDTTQPSIDVSYDNNSQDPNFEGLYKDNRTATIVVTERNFDPQNTVITVVNTEGGSAPKASEWTTVGGSGNKDDMKHIATILYSEDGDYTFDIKTTDLASNVNTEVNYGNSVTPKEFTVDKTIPTIDVNYNNNDAMNNNYYKAERTGTVTIVEHNFDASRVQATIQATDDGNAISAPSISNWSSSGDTHTASINYNDDALYTFDIQYTDMAGNEAAEFEEQEFYVDKTVPELEITGIEDKSANKGIVNPTITYSDTNFTAETVEITLTGANRKAVSLIGGYSQVTNGQVYQFTDFANTKEVDDIYTLTATLEDKAGNSSTQTIVFSVNRFGSTYMFTDDTEKLINKFASSPSDIEVIEINPDKLSDMRVTVYKDDKTIELDEGQFDVAQSGGAGQWYEYTYTIYADNFADDAVYNITLHSKDAAGNVSENTLDSKQKEISFGIDKTAPNVIITNLENGTTYPVESIEVLATANDNMKLVDVTVHLDGAEYKTWSEEEIEALIQDGEDFVFEITDSSTSAHTLAISCTDIAGNITTSSVEDFYVTTNLWVRYFNNKALFYGSIIGAAALAGAGAVFFTKRRKVKASK